MDSTEFNRKIYNFFSEYVDCAPDGLDHNGIMKNAAVQAAASLLIEEGVFTSVRSIRKQALRDYGIFLPDWVFKNIKEKKQ